MGRLPGALEQTCKECYSISGILGKEEQREGSWAGRGVRGRAGGSERMNMNSYCNKNEANEKMGRN